MSVKKEELKSIKLTAKGVLLEVSEEGLLIEDEKSGDQETLLFDDIRALVGKSVNIAIANKEQLEEE
jgi:uncharacterized protein YPO0396